MIIHRSWPDIKICETTNLNVDSINFNFTALLLQNHSDTKWASTLRQTLPSTSICSSPQNLSQSICHETIGNTLTSTLLWSLVNLRLYAILSLIKSDLHFHLPQSRSLSSISYHPFSYILPMFHLLQLLLLTSMCSVYAAPMNLDNTSVSTSTSETRIKPRAKSKSKKPTG